MATTLEQFLKENNPIAYADKFVANVQLSGMLNNYKNEKEKHIDVDPGILKNRVKLKALENYSRVINARIEELKTRDNVANILNEYVIDEFSKTGN